jgi:hypothetical protein
VSSRYALESRRSKDANFNKLKDRNRPVADTQKITTEQAFNLR